LEKNNKIYGIGPIVGAVHGGLVFICFVVGRERWEKFKLGLNDACNTKIIKTVLHIYEIKSIKFACQAMDIISKYCHFLV
jgi:hypothetical protein